MRAIIMANGHGTRWTRSPSKHETVIDGETLLARTVRLLRECAVEDIVISGPYPDYGVPAFVPLVEPERIHGRLAIRSLWNTAGRTVILMGDVFYTPEAMATIVEYEAHDEHLFARFGPSEITGKGWAEIFANSFWPEHHASHATALRAVAERFERGEIIRAGLWEVYLYDHGHPDDGYVGPDNPYTAILDCGDATVIDDWTDDFDWPADLDTFLERRAA